MALLRASIDIPEMAAKLSEPDNDKMIRNGRSAIQGAAANMNKPPPGRAGAAKKTEIYENGSLFTPHEEARDPSARA